MPSREMLTEEERWHLVNCPHAGKGKTQTKSEGGASMAAVQRPY